MKKGSPAIAWSKSDRAVAGQLPDSPQVLLSRQSNRARVQRAVVVLRGDCEGADFGGWLLALVRGVPHILRTDSAFAATLEHRPLEMR
jgi:hypothetical protein